MNRYLKEDERVLWSGVPSPELLWRLRERPVYAGGILLVVWMGGAAALWWSFGTPWPMLVPGLLLACLGAYSVTGHPRRARQQRRRVRYAITDRRVLRHMDAPEDRLWEWELPSKGEGFLEAEGLGLKTVVFGKRYNPKIRGAAWRHIHHPWSKGPPIPEPELIGLSEEDAEKALAALELAAASRNSDGE